MSKKEEDNNKYYGNYTNSDNRYYGSGYTSGYYGNGGYYSSGRYYSNGGGYVNGYTSGGNYLNGQDAYGGPQQPGTPQGAPSGINYKEWAMRLLAKWPLFLVGFLVALSVGFLINRKWMPQYTSEGQIFIDAATKSGPDFMQNIVGNTFSPLINGDQLLLMGSYNMINRTLQKLPFDVDFYQKGRFKVSSLYGREPIHISQIDIAPDAYAFEYRFVPLSDNTFRIEIADVYDNRLEKFAKGFKPIKANYGQKIECSLFQIVIDKMYIVPGQPDFFFRFRDLGSLESEFAGRLGLNFIGDKNCTTSVVSVQLTSSDYLRDCDFIDALMKEVIAYNLDEKNQEAARTIDFINSQLASLSDSLTSSEARLRSYRVAHNLVDISSYSGQVSSKLDELDTRRSELNLKNAYFESLSKYLTKTVMDEKIVAPSSIGVADPTLLELVSQFNELQQKRSDIGVKNPQYDRYSKRMNEIRLTLLEVIKNVKRIHDMERKSFEQEYDKVMSALKALPDREFEMVNYERAYKISDNYYTFLLQKLSEAQIIMASNAPDDKIFQEARTSLVPVNGKDKTMTYLICLLIGLLIPAAYVIIVALLDNKINNEEDIYRNCQFPVLSSLLHSDRKDLVISTKSKRSVFTERYRLLRTRIELFAQRKKDIVTVITSSESGDGKTSVSLNLAGIYSMISDRVLLVDMDLRNPSISKLTNYREHTGLVHLLIGEAEIDDVIVKCDERLGFDFIPSGVVPLNSAELIRSDRMTTVLEELRKRYDYIIVDTSPLGLVSDAIEMMKRADINIVVARALKTNKKYFRTFMQQIAADQIQNVYTVLNDVPIMKGKSIFGFGKYGKGYYYGGKYGYGYGGSYGYGYGSHYYKSDGTKGKTSDKYYHDEKYYQEDDSDNSKNKKD
ncbi:MAG: polysaccharide biosynthesis tyrosine autokinase [Paludibacteraceae bacterium]|nr:polysaccharide biosynthesis tyrosine autokinase [Paludibacteraceae bacterium]